MAQPAEVTREVAALRTAHRDLVLDAATHAAAAGADDPDRSLRDALDQAMHAVTGAVLTSDERLLTETSGWTSDVLRARGHRDADAIVHSALAHALRDYPLAAGLVHRHWPGTIRGDLSLSNRENLVHGSDSPESAVREIKIWFPGL